MSAIATRPKIKQAPRLKSSKPIRLEQRRTYEESAAFWTAWLAYDRAELDRCTAPADGWERRRIRASIELDQKMIAWTRSHGRADE